MKPSAYLGQYRDMTIRLRGNEMKNYDRSGARTDPFRIPCFTFTSNIKIPGQVISIVPVETGF